MQLQTVRIEVHNFKKLIRDILRTGDNEN